MPPRLASPKGSKYSTTVLLEHGVESVLGNAMVPLSNTCMVTSENCEQPADLNAPARPKHFGTPLALVL